MISEQYSEFVKTLAKPGEDIIRDATPATMNIVHAAIGLIGEMAGELTPHFLEGLDEKIDALKEDDFQGVEGAGSKLALNFREESGDTVWYAQLLHDALVSPNQNQAFWDIPVNGYLQDEPFTDGALLRGLFYAGQILDIAKKAAIYAKPLTPEQVDACQVHLRQVMYVMERMLDDGYGSEDGEQNVTINDVVLENMAKLRKRYEGMKFTNAAAQDRADKKDGDL